MFPVLLLPVGAVPVVGEGGGGEGGGAVEGEPAWREEEEYDSIIIFTKK